MKNLLRRPKTQTLDHTTGRYDRFGLTENPFPTEPVNRDSSDRRINGEIYESEIRNAELSRIRKSFLDQPQSNRNRLRLGYICDTSYIGRGNGKSAFLVNLAQTINREYCLDMAGGVNKCFALYLTPEPGGRTKTFPSFIDLVFESMLQSGMIDVCLASLRLAAIFSIYPAMESDLACKDEEELVRNVNNRDWLKERGIDILQVSRMIEEDEHLQALPPDFPLVTGRNRLIRDFVSRKSFQDHYFLTLRKGKERLDFVLSHLVHMFRAAGFNGVYLLVDDFERIPDFQSKRQQKDFAIELRSALLDGPSIGARAGFYTAMLVLHAGVPQLISEAWRLSGLENRYPIAPRVDSSHWIAFEKLARDDVSLLLQKYLSSYRLEGRSSPKLSPFTREAVDLIAELCENNAAKILRSCCDLLERAAEDTECTKIDKAFVQERTEWQGHAGQEEAPNIEDPSATDLMKKAMEGQR